MTIIWISNNNSNNTNNNRRRRHRRRHHPHPPPPPPHHHHHQHHHAPLIMIIHLWFAHKAMPRARHCGLLLDHLRLLVGQGNCRYLSWAAEGTARVLGAGPLWISAVLYISIHCVYIYIYIYILYNSQTGERTGDPKRNGNPIPQTLHETQPNAPFCTEHLSHAASSGSFTPTRWLLG